jgi:putrescine transport system substrate-binding protein
MRRILTFLTALCATGLGAASAADQRLTLYNWSDYLPPEILDGFAAETGIAVVQDTYSEGAVAEARLIAGGTGYDLAVVPSESLGRLAEAGALADLGRDRLEAAAALDAEAMARVDGLHADVRGAVPYLEGFTGIAYHEAEIAARMPDAPLDSWAMIFDPENAKKLQACGLTLLDAPGEVIDSALIFLGRDPNSEAPEDLAAAEELLMKIRPFVRYLHSSQYINDLANGEICVALGWSGDILQAQARGAEAATPVEVAYAIPKEGAIMWFDMLAIPADAPHPNNAHEFINYLMEPAVIAAVSDYVAYANANAASFEMIDEAVRTDPSVYPTPEVKAKLYPHLAESQEYSRLSNRAWTRFRTGQ